MKIKLTLFAALLLVAASTTKAQTYTGTITGAITLDNNASITLSNATITEGIICKGSATITLVGENVVTGVHIKKLAFKLAEAVRHSLSMATAR